MDILKDLNIDGKLTIASVATETTSMDGIFRASNGDMTKRVLGTMALQNTTSYYTGTASDARYLQSVAISLPAIFNVTTGTAIPSNQNLVAVLNSQAANTVFAGPNGSSGTPTFRSLVAGDIPALAISGITGLQTALDAKVSGSGTAGYLPKYTGSLALGNSILYENSGSLGIGTTNTVSQLTFGTFRSNTEETVGISLHAASIAGTLPAYGFGMGPAATEGYLTYRAGVLSTSLFGHKWFVNNVEVMRVRGDGRLGIGTNAPGYLLDVAGTGHFTGNVTFDANAILATAPTSGSHLVNKTYADLKLLAPVSGPSSGQYIKYNGSANVWATIAVAEVSGLQTALDAKLSGAGTTNYIAKYSGTGTMAISQLFDNATNVGIGNVSPAYKLDVNGTGHFVGNVTFDSNAIIATAPSSGSHAVNKTYADLKLLAPTSTPISGQYVRFDGTNNVWATVAISEVSGLQTALDAKLGGSGTANYVTKYTGSYTTAISQIFDNGSSVGINTALPDSGYKLDVNGIIKANAYNIGSNSSYTLDIGLAPAIQNYADISTSANRLNFFAFQNFTWTLPISMSLVQRMAVDATGLKIGTGNAAYGLDVAGSVGWTGALYVGNPAVSVAMSNGTDGQVLMRTTVSATAVNQWQTLAIANVSGLQAALDAKLSGSGTTGYLTKYTGSLTQGISTIYESSGNIGIGTTNTVSRLTFASFRNNSVETVGINLHQALTSGGLPAYGFGMGPAATEGYLTYRAGEGSTSLFGHKWFVNNVEVMRVRGDGRLGIGTTTPGYLLDVAGTGRFTGAVTFDAIPSTPIAATSANHIVNYATLQSYVAGIKYDSIKVKTVALTNITLSGHQTIAGYTTTGSDRVLVMGQTTASQNGVYIANSSTWTRDTNFDTDTEIRGFIHSVASGDYAGYKYINTNTSTITVGTTGITYVEFSSLVETDPVFTASSAYGITSTNISNWNDAYTNRISTKTTSDLSEGSNLYFTTARVLATALTGLTTGTNTAITSSDTVLSAFQNVQAQLNNKINIGGNSSGAAITIGTNDNYDFNLERNNAVQLAIKSGVIEANFDFDVKGKLKINGSTGTTGQFVKYNGTTTVWAGLSTTDLSDNADLIKLVTLNGERGFQLFSTDPNYANAFVWSNDDMGIALGLHGYSVNSSDVVKEFGIQLDTNGLLYHKKLDGTRSQIATVDMITGGGGSGTWNGGAISGEIYMNDNKYIYWDKNSSKAAYIGYSTQTLVTGNPKLFTVTSDDQLSIGAANELYIGGSKILIQKDMTSGPIIELDLSAAASFPDGQYLRFQVSTSAGIKKLTLVSD